LYKHTLMVNVGMIRRERDQLNMIVWMWVSICLWTRNFSSQCYLNMEMEKLQN